LRDTKTKTANFREGINFFWLLEYKTCPFPGLSIVDGYIRQDLSTNWFSDVSMRALRLSLKCL